MTSSPGVGDHWGTTLSYANRNLEIEETCNEVDGEPPTGKGWGPRVVRESDRHTQRVPMSLLHGI